MKKATIALVTVLQCSIAFAQRHMEYLNRGVYAINEGNGKVFVSWRLLGNEAADTPFELYRITAGKRELLATSSSNNPTWFEDSTADLAQENTYYVCNGRAKCAVTPANTFTLKPSAKPYLSIPLKTPPGYAPNDASVGDLDGDGQYEMILHQVGKARDNSQAGITDPPILQAYKLDGSFLWEINLGKNIREGAHYTQFMVYDLDGDGKAELALKTADGSRDSKGKIIGDSSKDWRNERGYIVSGPEYLTVFDGLSGEALFTTDYIAPRYTTTQNPTTDELKKMWGDGYGNRFDRFLACVAYLDGVHPSLVMCRGYYTRTILAAWDWDGKHLKKRWVFDTMDKGNENYAGQGNHNLTVTDVDGDGRDEIVYGQMTVNDNGKGLYTTGIGHADALHVSDLDPSRPGLEVFGIQEHFGDAGANFRDARTGEVIWKKASVKAGDDGEGPGRGLALDIDPRYPGAECWVAGAGITGMFTNKGEKIAEKTPPCNMGIFWDGDEGSEVLNGVDILKWDYQAEKSDVLFSGRPYDCVSNNGTKANPCLSADILGDWREELITRTKDNQELRIFSTTLPTPRRLTTLMHNPQYRLSIAWQNVAYNQPPHTSFFMGYGMQNPPQPNIVISKNSKPDTKHAKATASK